MTFRSYATGTIVHKRFNDGKFYEGEIVSYDDTEKFYKIKFTDGDTEEFTHREVTKHKKKRQNYSTSKSNGQANATYRNTGKYDENFFFYPTKACPNPVKRDYLRTKARSLLHHAMAAGSVWDEDLGRFASFRDLLTLSLIHI